MQLEVNGATMWFDVVGPSLVVEGSRLRTRPTLVAIHGGPGGYDHSYLRPHLDRLAALAQVVYVDLPGHGRSEHGSADSWSLERCADDLAALLEQLGIAQPLLFGHSMGGYVALSCALRHPDSAGGLLLQATAARHDVARIVDGFRTRFGEELADAADRIFGGGTTTDEDNRRVLDAFGPNLPDDETYQRVIPNAALRSATPRLVHFDVVADLHRIEVPTLITVGSVDPVTPVVAAHEIARGLAAAPCRLEVLHNAGHFPWLDDPDRYWPPIERFIEAAWAAHSDVGVTGDQDLLSL